MEYRDMTFCTAWRSCAKGATCERALTDEVYENARKWWGTDDPPLSVYEGQPLCLEENT